MTFWFYNPPEPTGQLTEPGPWDAPGQNTAFRAADSVTHGRCGNCAACPKVWRLEVLDLPLDPHFSGVYYLNRLPYFFNNEYFSGLCVWSSLPHLPFPDRQTYGENLAATSMTEGWTLAFGYLNFAEGYRWALFTPLINHLFGNFDQSLYLPHADYDVNHGWNCLGPNTMRHYAQVGSQPYPYIQEFVTLTPHPA